MRVWREWGDETAAEVAAARGGPLQLAVLSYHSGSINCVRWSHDGSFLASSSDDHCVIVYTLKVEAAQPTFGSSDAPNAENWVPRLTMRGHTADVKDVAWSPDDAMLATCSVDNTVCVWDCRGPAGTVQPLRRFADHTNWVEGIAWDPIGKYIASASMDKSVIVRRVSDWGCEAKIEKHYQECTGAASFFCRLSWSPDGKHLCTTRARDKTRDIAAMVSRGDWMGDCTELVGHATPVVAARFNPRMLSNPRVAGEFCCCALGTQDGSISVWVTHRPKPLFLVKDVFQRTLLDLSWAADGLTLFGCSLDGSICRMKFEQKDRAVFGAPISDEALVAVRKKAYGNLGVGAAVQLAETPSQLLPPPRSSAAPSRVPSAAAQAMARPQMQTSHAASTAQRQVSSMSNGRKRIQPVLLSQPSPPRSGGASLAGSGGARTAMAASAAAFDRRMVSSGAEQGGDKRQRTSTGFVQAQAQPAAASSRPIEIQPPHPPVALPEARGLLVSSWSSGEGGASAGGERGAESTLECRKVDGGTAVVCSREGATAWSDALAGETANCMIGTEAFCAVGCASGSLYLYSPVDGRRLLPCIALGEPICRLGVGAAVLDAAAAAFLMVLQTDGAVQVWDVRAQRSLMQLSAAPLFHAPHAAIIAAEVNSDGMPLLTVSRAGNVQTFLFHRSMACWLRVADQDFADSDFASIGLGATHQGPLARLQAAAAASRTAQPVAASLLARSMSAAAQTGSNATRRYVAPRCHARSQLCRAMLTTTVATAAALALPAALLAGTSSTSCAALPTCRARASTNIGCGSMCEFWWTRATSRAFGRCAPS